MAREPQVTRTIQTTEVVALCLNIETKESFEKVVSLSRTYKDAKKLRKALEEAVNTDTVKVVHIISTETKTSLYAMSEQKFIENAEILPVRNSIEKEN